MLFVEKKVKYLGLMIDGKFSWKDHNDNLIASLATFYWILDRKKYFVPKKQGLAIHKAYVFF